MNHSDFEDLLSAYADGELARTQREFVERHLAGCADCRATVADHTWERHKLTSLRAAPAPSGLKSATMTRIEVSRGFLATWRVLGRTAVVVATAIVVAIVFGIVHLLGTGPAGPIARAEAATAALRSYRAVESVSITKRGETFETRTEVEVASPDAFRAKTADKSGGIVEVIGLGDNRYARGTSKDVAYLGDVTTKIGGFLDLVTGPDTVDTAGLATSKERALEILDSLVNLEQLPDKEIDGIPTLRYRGTIDWGKLGWGTKGKKGDPGSPSYVELWIDKENYTIRLAEVQIYLLVEDPNYEKTEQFVIRGLVKYFDLNEPIEVRSPVTPTGDLEAGWSLLGPLAQKNKIGPVGGAKQE